MSHDTPERPSAEVAPALGSRRLKLWQLPAQLHEPLIGHCLPIHDLRALLDKLFGGRSSLDDINLHSGAVAQCTTRNKVSQALQQAFDLRFAATLRHFSQARTGDAVEPLWTQALLAGDVAGGLWATLTHARCAEVLRERVVRDLHMLRYELAASLRTERLAADALHAQNKVLNEELARARQRQQQALAERLADRAQFEMQLRQVRAQLVASDAMLATALKVRSQVHEKPGVPPVDQRHEAASTPLATAAAPCCTAPRPAPPQAGPLLAHDQPLAGGADALERAAAALQSRNVLCVGGRGGQIPIYRELVERQGGRFAHHDGGIEDNAHRLDAQLAAADLVICQAGSLNHNAYARVKAHVKRNGKPCLYLDRSGAAGLLRALAGREAVLPMPSLQNL
jgi:hypothetical protein